MSWWTRPAARSAGSRSAPSSARSAAPSLIRWFGSRYVGTTLALLGVAATALIGFLLVGTANPAESNVLVFSFLAGVSFNGMQAFMYAVAAHSYPTEIRGSAVGLAQTVSRIGAVMSPIIASGYLAMQPLPGENLFFWFVAGCAFITALSFFLIPSHIPRQDPPEAARSPATQSSLSEGLRASESCLSARRIGTRLIASRRAGKLPSRRLRPTSVTVGPECHS